MKTNNESSGNKNNKWLHHISIFYSNITTWGPQAKDYFYDKSRPAYRADIHCIIEHHTINAALLRNAFSLIKRAVITNPPGPSPNSAEGTHGGELIAYAKYLSIAAVDPHIIDSLTEDKNQVRFACSRIRSRRSRFKSRSWFK